MAPVDEAAVRAELWARQQVWHQQQQQRQHAPKSKVLADSKLVPAQQQQHVPKSKALAARKSEPPQRRRQQQQQSPTTKVVPSRKLAPTQPSAQKPGTKQAKPAAAPPQGRRVLPQKPSEALPQRLGLGRIADLGGGQVKGRTRFASAYKSGSLGQWLRVDQNGAKPDLAFVVDVETIPLNVVLPLCFDGLSESTHPLCLLARRGATRLLEEHPLARDKSDHMKQSLPHIVGALRNALACKERDVVRVAIEHTSLLARVAQELLLDYLEKLLPPLARLAFGGSPLTSKALDAIREIETHVPGSRPKIKAKLPSFD